MGEPGDEADPSFTHLPTSLPHSHTGTSIHTNVDSQLVPSIWKSDAVAALTTIWDLEYLVFYIAHLPTVKKKTKFNETDYSHSSMSIL